MSFNSGVAVIEPAMCTFNDMLHGIETQSIGSYNGGDQGFLNEFFPLFNPLPMKFFAHGKHQGAQLKDDKIILHLYGIKPWRCFSKEEDCVSCIPSPSLSSPSPSL